MTTRNLNDIAWTDLIQDPEQFEIDAAEFYQQHVASEDLDYAYEKNITVDTEYFLNLKTYEKYPFSLYVGKFRRVDHKEYTDTYTDILVASEPDYAGPEVARLKQDLHLDELYCLQQTQLPGTLVGQHMDLNRGLSNMLVNKDLADRVKLKHIRKYIVYLDDWAHGQVFMSGRHAFTNWKKGDVMSFPWFMPHSTANTGFHARPILFISGVEF